MIMAVLCPYHRILLRNKKEQTNDTYNRMDEPQKHYVEQKGKAQRSIFSMIAIYVKFSNMQYLFILPESRSADDWG